jgi:hypothetical protein
MVFADLFRGLDWRARKPSLAKPSQNRTTMTTEIEAALRSRTDDDLFSTHPQKRGDVDKSLLSVTFDRTLEIHEYDEEELNLSAVTISRSIVPMKDKPRDDPWEHMIHACAVFEADTRRSLDEVLSAL